MRTITKIQKTWPLWALTVAIAVGCGKKKDDDDDDDDDAGGAPRSTGTAGGGGTSEGIANPAGVLSLALDSFSSLEGAGIGATLTGGGASLLDDANEFTEADCDEHAEAVARSSDDAQYKDDSNRLRLDHPRSALQNGYCQITKDTGSPDSLLGTISSAKMIFCIMGSGHSFDGVERPITRSYDDLVACLPAGATDADKEEMFGTDTSITIEAKITASAPPAYGDASSWDGSLQMVIDDFGGQKIDIKLLLKDSGGVTAIASLAAEGRDIPVNSYVVAINQSTGEAWLESKFQRMRTPDGSGSNGWNRHTATYVKGTIGADYKFTGVSAASLAFSDISMGNNAAAVTDPLQYGKVYTVNGSDDSGFKSHAYELACSGSGMGSYVCEDAALAASWTALAGSGACNGALSGTTCTGDGVELTADANTEFIMVPESASFQTTEDWFETLALPTFTQTKLAKDQ